MKHPLIRGILAALAVLVVLGIVKAIGLSPNDVFAPRENWHVETPFGNIAIAGDRHGWFNPLLLMHILCVPAMWHLCRRAGYSSWFSLAMLIPLANVLLLYFLAFSAWPTQPQDDRPRGTSAADEMPAPRKASDDIRI